jgi:hypothetical protein
MDVGYQSGCWTTKTKGKNKLEFPDGEALAIKYVGGEDTVDASVNF